MVRNHHNSGILRRVLNEIAEVDLARTREVRADVLHHAGDGEQQRLRNDAGRGDRRLEEKDDDHKQSTFEEILFDRRYVGFDRVGPIVDRPRDEAFRQRTPDLLELGRDPFCHRTAVFADQQRSGAEHTRTGMPLREPITISLVSSILPTCPRGRTILFAVALDAAGHVGVVRRECRHDVAEAVAMGPSYRRSLPRLRNRNGRTDGRARLHRITTTPSSPGQRFLGRFFGPVYARWCVRRRSMAPVHSLA